MGLLGAIGAGFREVGGATEKIGLEQLKDQMEQERAARLMELQQAMKEKAVAKERQAAADVVSGVARTRDETVEDESGGHVRQTQKSDKEYNRDIASAFANKGMLAEAEMYSKRVDWFEDNDRQSARDKSQADYQTASLNLQRESAEATKLHQKAMLANAQASLGLKQDESRRLDNAMSSYIGAKANYEALKDQKAPDADMKAAKSALESAALRLQEWKIQPNDPTNPLAKHMSLSASLSSLNKTLENEEARGVDTTDTKAAIKSIIQQMTNISAGVAVPEKADLFPPKKGAAAPRTDSKHPVAPKSISNIRVNPADVDKVTFDSYGPMKY